MYSLINFPRSTTSPSFPMRSPPKRSSSGAAVHCRAFGRLLAALLLLVLALLESAPQAAAQSREAALDACRARVGRPIVGPCMRAGGDLESCRARASPAVRQCMANTFGGGFGGGGMQEAAAGGRARTARVAEAPKRREAAKPAKAAAAAVPTAVTPLAPAAIAPSITAPTNDRVAVTGGRRVALVIGNSNYGHVPVLPNAANDAKALHRELTEAGFQSVTLKLDLRREDLVVALSEFAQIADNADWAVMYYSGHGIEYKGNNYLIPIDARLRVDRDIDLESIDIGKVLSAAESARRLRLVVLDACRNNPFLDQMKRTVAMRALTRGLARAEPDAGTLIVYSAKHGELALDGDGDNSPFALALLRRLKTPNLEIRRLFDLVRDDVLLATNKKQQPYSYGSLSGSEDFFFLAR